MAMRIKIIHIRRDMYRNCGKLYNSYHSLLGCGFSKRERMHRLTAYATKKMSLRGIRNSQSITLVSGSTPTPSDDLTVAITVPESPFTGDVATILFNWKSGGAPADVQGFGIGGVNGSNSGFLFNFQQVSASAYSVQVRLQSDVTEYTVIVRANSAALVSDPEVRGPAADVSATFTVETPTVVKPIVNIRVPAERPILVRPVPLEFSWVYPDGTPAPMENFDLTDTETDVGTIGNFAQVTGDASKYTADLTIPQADTSTQVTVTVSADSAQVANSNPAILGPEEDTSKTFEIAAPPAVATVTGADSVCVLEKDIISNDYLNDAIAFLGDNAGGAFAVVLESASIGDYLYMVVQIRKFRQTVDDDGDLVTPSNPENFFADLQAGAALVRLNTTNCQFELLKAYSDVTLAARSLEVDGTTLYFIEGAHYMYDDGVIFSDQQWREKIGYVYQIEHPSSRIQTLGRNWRSATTGDNPNSEETDYFYGVHGGTATPMAIVDEALHLITGYGNFDDIGQPRGEHPVNRIGNWNWIQYDDQINQRLSEVPTNGRTGFDVLKDIAIVTNSVLGFKKDGTFFMRPREPQKAVNAASGITATQTTLTATKLNWGRYPSEGWLYIDGELIKHSGADENGQFADLVRGAEETTATAHTGDFEIQFVNHILSLDADTLEVPIKSIVAQNDNRQFYNRVIIAYGDGEETPPAEDAISIVENGARLLENTVPLDSHQHVWAEWLSQSYLARFKDIHQILNLTLKPSLYLNVMDTVYLKIPERMHLSGTLCQVLEIPDAFRQPPSTSVKLVTL